MNILEELTCGDGTQPSGPVSAWPQKRHNELLAKQEEQNVLPTGMGPTGPRAGAVTHQTKVTAGLGKMAQGLIKTAGQAVVHGRVSEEVRSERYETCKACPFFVEESKRCSECGCFMEAKTWVGGDPNQLCPKQKWGR